MFKKRNHRRGFTLIELLVVISIITILAAIATVVAFVVFAAGQEAAITVDMSNIVAGLEKYRLKYGDYPPDCAGDTTNNPGGVAAIANHIRLAWPRFSGNANAVAGTLLNELEPDTALVYFLSRLQQNARGPFVFSGSPTIAPLTGKEDVMVEFDETRLVLVTRPDPTDPTNAAKNRTWQAYVQPQGERTAYVYFNSKTYAYSLNNRFGQLPLAHPTAFPVGATGGSAGPYVSDGTGSFMEPKKYQLISAGLDGNFGDGVNGVQKLFPSGTNMTIEDDDNLSSFSQGKTLADARP